MQGGWPWRSRGTVSGHRRAFHNTRVARYRFARERGETELPLVDHWTLRELEVGQRLSYNGELWVIRAIEPYAGKGPEPYAGLIRAEPAERRG